MGYICEGDGLGRQTAELIDVFRDEITINFVPTRKEKGSKIPSRFEKHLAKKQVKWGKVIIFEDMLWRPGKAYYKRILSSNRGKSIRIAYSVWESTKIPDKWVKILNKHFDACVVASPFLMEVYRNCGVQIPIFELPLGLNLDRFLEQPLKKELGKPFVFGNLSACSDRKNQQLLVRAFSRKFGNDPNFLLRINSRYGERVVREAIEKEVQEKRLTNVIFTHSSLTQEEYLSLFKSIDCYVSPSKGEGFSIQPREAMALGIPVIATDNTGQAVICRSGLVKALPSPMKLPAKVPWGDVYGISYSCTEEELASAMLETYVEMDQYLKSSEKCRAWAAKYRYHSLSAKYRSLIFPKKVILQKNNSVEEDELRTSSLDLYNKYKNIFKF